MKFESLDVVKQLHDEGEIAQKELHEVTLNSPRVKSQTNLDNDNMSRKSPLMRHLNFAKQDSQSSIIEISKYPQYMDNRHEPHVQSSGSIILKEPSVMSSS